MGDVLKILLLAPLRSPVSRGTLSLKTAVDYLRAPRFGTAPFIIKK